MNHGVGLAPPAPEHDESFEELAAAAALGSIEPDDAVRFRPHAAACARCRELLSDYGAVLDLLPLSLPEAPEAPVLKARLLAAAEGDAETRRRGDAEAALSPLPRVPASPRLRVSYWLPLAAMLLISLGLGWWNLALQEQLRGQQARIERQEQFIAAVAAGGRGVALAGTGDAPGATGQVVQPPGGGPPLLTVHGLPALPAERVYQVWVISGGQPAGAGLLRPEADGPPIVALERDLAGAQTVALTIEPRGGSPGPTGPIVLAGNL